MPLYHLSSLNLGWNVCQVAVLVNNAGLALGKAPAQDNDISDISVMLDTNCKAVAVLTKAVSKGMIARNMVPSTSPHLEATCSLPKSCCRPCRDTSPASPTPALFESTSDHETCR